LTADSADPELLRFHESLGAVAQTEKVFYRLTGQALAAAAQASSRSQA